MKFELILELIKLIDNSKLIELEMNLNDISLKIKKNQGESKTVNTLVKTKKYSLIKLNDVIGESASALDKQNLESYITSPVVGTYYSSQKGLNIPFVKLGDKVKRGSVVCIIEILNIDYEIKSDVDGYVLEVLALNGCMVEYGQRLFRIKRRRPTY